MKTYLTFGILILCALLVTNVANLAAEENWTRKADMPVSKFGHAAEVINGKIYILTGADPDDAPFATVEVYAPEGFPQSVDPTGKLPVRWGTLKSGSAPIKNIQ